MSKTLYVDNDTKNELVRLKPDLFTLILFLRMLLWIWRSADVRCRIDWEKRFKALIRAQEERVAE